MLFQPERTPLQPKTADEDREWPLNYFRETDPEKRKKILAAVDSRGDGGLTEQLKKLFELRYRNGGKNGYTDIFLQSFFRLRLAAEELDRPFGRKRGRKTAEAELNNLCLDGKSAFSDKMMYREMCNLTAFYIVLSSGDINYTSVLWGLGKKNDDKILRKIELDLDRIGEALPQYLEMEEEFRILTRAISDTKRRYLYEPEPQTQRS